jgi:hypothetical protein
MGSRNAAIVRAIVAMTESLGMDSTAEGAETAEELALIRQLGCSQVQGHIFGQPMPPEAALKLAEESNAEAALPQSRSPRHGLIRLATLTSGDLSLPVRLRNISAGGAMVESERGVPRGAKVRLDLHGCGTIEGEVRWSQPGRLGIRFGEDFDLRKLSPPKRRGNVRELHTGYYAMSDDPAVPWEARNERLNARDIRRF